MAKGSKKGACSSNTQSAKANCLAHDRRSGKVPSYVNPHLSHTNRIVFEDEMIRGRKSIVPLVHQAEKLYTEKTGQKVQASFAAFRESCLTLREGITDEQLLKFKAEAERLTGWKCIGIYLHQDEGHVHSKYIEGDEAFAINYHAHVLWDCQDHLTGKSIKCKRAHLSQMQDLLSAATGMERGNKASETGLRHRSALQQRIDAQEERIAELERISKAKDKEIEKLSRAAAAKDATIQSLKAAGSWLKGKLNLSDKDNVIKAQKAQIASLTKERDDAKADAQKSADKAAEAKKEGIKEALERITRSTGLHPAAEKSIENCIEAVNGWISANHQKIDTITELKAEVKELKEQMNAKIEENQTRRVKI